MSEISFENFGTLARAEGLSDTEAAGRYAVQAHAEKRILADVIAKLMIGPGDDVLDIGCGVGLLLIPLSYLARSVVGVDHPDVVKRLGQRFSGQNVTLSGANFLDFETDRRFDAALAYGVVNYMRDEAQLHAFVDKAVAFLKPGGRFLIGDIPNQSKKKRFLESPAGAAFQADWAKQMASNPGTFDRPAQLADPDLLAYTDGVILRLLERMRGLGLDAYVLPQPADLPFGNTREDVLITKP